MKSEEVVCLFPTCKSHPQKNGYCIGHRIYANSSEVKEEKEKVKPIAKRAKKMQKSIRQLKKDYPQFLSKAGNELCQLRMGAGCTNLATVVHHTEGREGNNLTDQSKWKASCVWCNLMAEIKDAEARKKGVKKSKHPRDYKRSKV